MGSAWIHFVSMRGDVCAQAWCSFVGRIFYAATQDGPQALGGSVTHRGGVDCGDRARGLPLLGHAAGVGPGGAANALTHRAGDRVDGPDRSQRRAHLGIGSEQRGVGGGELQARDGRDLGPYFQGAKGAAGTGSVCRGQGPDGAGVRSAPAGADAAPADCPAQGPGGDGPGSRAGRAKLQARDCSLSAIAAGVCRAAEKSRSRQPAADGRVAHGDREDSRCGRAACGAGHCRRRLLSDPQHAVAAAGRPAHGRAHCRRRSAGGRDRAAP